MGAAREPGLQRLRLPRLLSRSRVSAGCGETGAHRPAGAAAGSPSPAPAPLIPPRCRPSRLLRWQRGSAGCARGYRRSQNAAPRSGTQPSKWSPCARAGQGCQGSGPLRGPLPRPIPLPPGRLPELPAVQPWGRPGSHAREERGRKDGTGAAQGPRDPRRPRGGRPTVGGRRAAPNWRLRSGGPGVRTRGLDDALPRPGRRGSGPQREAALRRCSVRAHRAGRLQYRIA